ncbi:hypothetical protein ABT093_37945 [Kitasatospora sp. NPDC002551]|uniref:hypothetical protein n=1 Tax=Kitasatospora sp. NPDC002551 TaxID=3154539 RepID=UPI0033228C62
MEKLIPEKLFPTERATAGHRLRIIATICYPVTGLMTGTPVLIRKLTAPQLKRRAEAADLRTKAAELAAEATAFEEAAFAKKLAEADPAKRRAMIHAREAAQVAAKEVAAELAKADRKAARSKLGDSAGAAALLLIVGGPLVWSLARPLIGPGIGLLLGGWWIAALMHAPAKEKQAKESASTAGRDQVVADDRKPSSEEGPATEEEPVEEAQEPPAATLPTPADASRAVAFLGADGTHVALSTVVAHLAAEHPSWERSGKAVKALLQGAGIRYRDGVKVDGTSVPGIHRDDVPPLPSPPAAAPGSVVVAGQSNNNNHNNARKWSTREGFVMRTDPDNPARTIVVQRPTAAPRSA